MKPRKRKEGGDTAYSIRVGAKGVLKKRGRETGSQIESKPHTVKRA